jgi:hypothetical protein
MSAFDLIRSCRDCGETFIVPEAEAQRLKERFARSYKPPTRCRACRRALHDTRAQATQESA